MNNENKKTAANFMAGKGLYIVLFLCVSAIGISGYFLADSLFSREETAITAVAPVAEGQEDKADPSESVPAENEENKTLQSAQTVSGQDEAVTVMADADDLNAQAAAAAAEAASAIRIWPLSGAVSKDYSVETLVYSETTDDWRTHNGVDLLGYLGEPVMAVTAGTVSQIYEDDMYGTTVVITHADSVSSHYSNLAVVPTVTVGQTVAAGDVIGAVGDTALLECADEPHLHLEVFKEGIAMDPEEYIEE